MNIVILQKIYFNYRLKIVKNCKFEYFRSFVAHCFFLTILNDFNETLYMYIIYLQRKIF